MGRQAYPGQIIRRRSTRVRLRPKWGSKGYDCSSTGRCNENAGELARRSSGTNALVNVSRSDSLSSLSIATTPVGQT